MTIFRTTERPTRIGEGDAFTGFVQLDPIIGADPAGLVALSVTFAPGARTHWHTHERGQTLHVTRGAGLYAERGQPPRRITAGDTVWIAPGLEHWHGAAPDTGMTHIAMQACESGSGTNWLEPVVDSDYVAATTQ
ncbi:(R)-mandelonitrile lyase [Oceanibium sediminis]|uniref:(R)-mandelonitrile lyase n=1 Tax=Oceanibium sediminis TaxID=2026339 RepID=UPI000DD3D8D3|nr:cupin domain-containing protein [Oceanibium sediminis]